MATDLADFPEWKCPYCGNLLTNEEYNYAMEGFRIKAEQKYEERRPNDIQYFEEEKRRLIEKNQEEMDNFTKFHNMHSDKILEDLKTSYHEQMENLKETYEELSKQRQEDFDESLSQKMVEYEHELYEKDKRLQELETGLADFKARATDQAKTLVRNEIEERDTQINRLKKKVDELGKQLSQTQSELKGEAAEINLLRILQNEFQDKGDHFEKETRGSCGADIIQQIRTTSRELLENKIAYDNKESAAITKQDIEKAKKDKERLQTDYFIIVSRNLPKRDCKDGLYGEKEGILLVHPDIIVAVAWIIRRTIIEISKEVTSKQDLKTKQSKIYDHVRSREFNSQIESICETHKRMFDLQEKERKDHETTWKKREELQKQLRDVHIRLRSGIDAIIQGSPTLCRQNISQEKDAGIESSEDGDTEDHSHNNPS